MRTGYENGYEVITLSDCVAATSVEEHDNALKYDYPMFSKPMASDDVRRRARRLTRRDGPDSPGAVGSASCA